MNTSNYSKHTSSSRLQQYFIERFYEQAFALLQSVQPTRIVDVGCGEGFTLARLAEVGIGEKLEGVDYAKEAITIGKKLHPTLSLKQGDIYDLPYKDQSVDVVLCMEVLEHLEDPKRAIRELWRVTKRYCLLSVPHEPFFMLANFLRGKNLSRWGNDIEHINHWTSPAFSAFVKATPFEIVSRRLPFPWTMVLAKK